MVSSQQRGQERHAPAVSTPQREGAHSGPMAQRSGVASEPALRVGCVPLSGYDCAAPDRSTARGVAIDWCACPLRFPFGRHSVHVNRMGNV